MILSSYVVDLAGPLQAATPALVGHALPDAAVEVHAAMPALAGGRYPWFRRLLPESAFYVAPALMWAALALRHGSLTLPTSANPAMEVGGLWGEAKSHDLDLFGPAAAPFVAPHLRWVRGAAPPAEETRHASRALEEAGLSFPLMVKPDRGCQGWGVRVTRSPEELAKYLADTPPGVVLIVQALVPWDGEAAIFYVRRPGASQGRIASAAFVYAPHVVGDGRRSIGELVQTEPVLRAHADVHRAACATRWDEVPGAGEVVVLTQSRSARLGAVYRDMSDLVTPALEATIERIASSIPDFHFGRFDIRFRSLPALREGRDLLVVEVNGAGGEMLHIWDGRTRFRHAYRDLWRQYRALFEVGAAMRRRGHKPAGLRHMLAMLRQQERLRRLYPPTT